MHAQKFSETCVRSLNNYLPRMIYELHDGDPTTCDWFIETFGEENPGDVMDVLRNASVLSGDNRALAVLVLRRAEVIKGLSKSVRNTLEHLKHDIVASRAGLSISVAFEARATRALQNMERGETVSAIVD